MPFLNDNSPSFFWHGSGLVHREAPIVHGSGLVHWEAPTPVQVHQSRRGLSPTPVRASLHSASCCDTPRNLHLTHRLRLLLKQNAFAFSERCQRCAQPLQADLSHRCQCRCSTRCTESRPRHARDAEPSSCRSTSSRWHGWRRECPRGS